MVAWHRCRSLGATRPSRRRDFELGRRRFGRYVDGGGQRGGIAPKRVNGDSAWRIGRRSPAERSPGMYGHVVK
jgi:hypothetical protein